MVADAPTSPIRSIHVIAWRDLDDPSAGGSEIHLNHLLHEWVDAGIDVTLRTAAVAGQPDEIDRDGIRVIRRGGKLGIWLRTVVASVSRRDGRFDARLEVWHGISFFSPMWSRLPTVGIFHHVHSTQFAQVLPRGLSHVARFLERRVYPRLYRGHRLVVLSESVRQQMITELAWPADELVVVEPGVSDAFVPPADGVRSSDPLVVVVGRMMPQKRLEDAVDVLARVRAQHPTLRAVLIGHGPERERVLERINESDARSWIDTPGWVSDDDLIRTYQQAWVVLSCSRNEGWGMSVTEGAACGAPAVVTDISGHREAMIDGVTGILAADNDALVAGVERLLSDGPLRTSMAAAAEQHARQYRWDAAASRVLAELESVALR